VKPNTFLRRHSIKLAVLGSLAFAAQVACSDDPAAPGTGAAGSTSNGGSNTAGTGTAGTNTAAGTGTGGTGTAGTGTAGTFTTAGTETGGTATGGTGGTGTAGTATAGTGGSVITPVDPFCKGKTLEALPYTVNTGFIPFIWGPDAAGIAEMKVGDQITPAPAADFCKTDRVPGSKGTCWMWQWTPADPTPTPSFVVYVRQFDANYTHPEVCLADGAKYVSFYARGQNGGEVVTVGSSEAADVKITLTADWKVYSIPLDGVTYNSFGSGFEKGFSWKIEPPAVKSLFWIDNIQVVKTLPADPSGGGEGGAGGAGGAAN
jgi:hypothetical protein